MGAWTTKGVTIFGGGGGSKLMRVWDESGTGAGPFLLGTMEGDGAGGSAGGATSAPKVSVTMQRPANAIAYDAGDTIADHVASGSVTEMFFSTVGLGPVIAKIRLKKSNVSVPAKIRVHFYDAGISASSGDNEPFTKSGINSLGSYVVDVSEIGINNTVGLTDVNIPIGAATAIYVAFEAEEGFLPASGEFFTLSVWTGTSSGSGSGELLQAVDELEGFTTTIKDDIALIKADGAATRAAVESNVPVQTRGDLSSFRKVWTVLAADGAQTNYKLLDCPTGSQLVITQIGAKLSCDATVTALNCRLGLAVATLPAAALAGADIILSGKFAVASIPGEKIGNGNGVIAVGTDDQDLRLTCDAPTGGDLRIEASGYFLT